MASSGALRRLDPSAPHGIYVYSKEGGGWVAAARGDIEGDGAYVIYFSNSECGACRVFDDVWYPAVEKLAERASAKFVVVLCGWFARKCGSDEAASLFREFDIHVSPSVVYVRRANGRVAKLLKYEGLVPSITLLMVYANVLSG